MDGGGTFFKPLLGSPLGKEHRPGLPGGSGRSGARRPRCFQRFTLGTDASHELPTCALVSVSPGLALGAERSRRAPALPPPSALSFDFLLKALVSVGVRKIVAFPFIPPLT